MFSSVEGPEMSELSNTHNDDEADPSYAGEYNMSDAVALEMGSLREEIAHVMWTNANGHQAWD
jgi:hypothetical protein